MQATDKIKGSIIDYSSDKEMTDRMFFYVLELILQFMVSSSRPSESVFC